MGNTKQYTISKRTGQYKLSEIFAYSKTWGGYIEYVCQLCYEEVGKEDRKAHRDEFHKL